VLLGVFADADLALPERRLVALAIRDFVGDRYLRVHLADFGVQDESDVRGGGVIEHIRNGKSVVGTIDAMALFLLKGFCIVSMLVNQLYYSVLFFFIGAHLLCKIWDFCFVRRHDDCSNLSQTVFPLSFTL
jgi:hypothetical protein